MRQTWTENGTTKVMDFIYDDKGAPYAFRYNNKYHYYVLNLQGDVVKIVAASGDSYGVYRYDAWGNITYSTNNDVMNSNPLRYRGYVYDTETGFYYLQSRYYDPAIGRFINADAFASTGQGFLGYNMFAYCGNNPINNQDPEGNKVVGVGVQMEIQLGNESVGLEIIVYFEPTICEGNDYVAVMYTYSGYEVSVADVANVAGKVQALLMTGLSEANNTLSHEENICYDTLLGAITSYLDGIGASGSFFWIDATDGFNSPHDYSNGFETLSLSGTIGNVAVSGFHAYSEKCDVYGVRVGAKAGVFKPLPGLPIGFSYSRTYYSKPIELGRGNW